jgi:hypothetical protein
MTDQELLQQTLNSSPYVHIIPTVDSLGSQIPITVTISGSGGGGTSFNGQLTQDGNNVSYTNPLPVSGSINVNFPATQSVFVTNFPTTQSVVGTITASISNFPTTQSVTGSVVVSSLIPSSSTSALQTTGNTSLDNIDKDLGTLADSAWSGTGNGSLISIQKALWNKFLTDTNGNLKVNTSATTFTYSPNNSTNGNSSVFVLANGGIWNGTLENAINQPYLISTINCNRNVTITASQFTDAAATINAVPDISYTITANIPFPLPLAVQGNFIKLSVNNTSGASANLIVDSYYGPLPVQPNSLTQLGNFKSAIVEVGGVAVPATGILVTGRTGQPTVSPTITAASAYTAGNLVGGLMTFSNCFATGLTSGVLQSVVIKSKSVQTATFKLYIFSQQPTNTTWTDKTSPAINVLDLPYLIDMFIFAAPDSGLGTMTIYTQDGLGKSIANTASGQNLWGLLVTTGTPTFSSTTDISVTLGILQD